VADGRPPVDAAWLRAAAAPGGVSRGVVSGPRCGYWYSWDLSAVCRHRSCWAVMRGLIARDTPWADPDHDAGGDSRAFLRAVEEEGEDWRRDG
jgi:hypothetical protein